MVKIDKRKNYYLVIDTETCPIDANIEKVTAYNMLAYDIGFAVVDKKGNVYEQASYIVEDIFINEPTKMRSAYYYDKMPQYIEDMLFGDRVLETFSNIREAVWEMLEKYNITEVYAHNMYFDNIVLRKTAQWLHEPEMFFPVGTHLKCTMRFAECCLTKQKMYRYFCESTGYMTKHKSPRVRKTAEIIYRYLINDTDFIESHTALEDVLIEKEILSACFRQHCKKKDTIIVDIIA